LSDCARWLLSNDRWRPWLLVAALSVAGTARAAAFEVGHGVADPDACVCDCNGDGEITIDEIIRAVNIGIGLLALEQCPAGDANNDLQVSIDEIIRGINGGIDGCVAPTATPTPSPTPLATLPCVDVSGSWSVSETGSITCEAPGQSETQPVEDTVSVSIEQNGCDIGYDVPGTNIHREGTVDGDHVTVSGDLIVQASGMTVTENVFTARGQVMGDRMSLSGSGIAEGNVSSLGDFTCTGSSQATLTRAGVRKSRPAGDGGHGAGPIGLFALLGAGA
jgi:hypothetical protein